MVASVSIRLAKPLPENLTNNVCAKNKAVIDPARVVNVAQVSACRKLAMPLPISCYEKNLTIPS